MRRIDSKEIPKTVIRTSNGYQINFDIQSEERAIEDSTETEAFYSFCTVEVKNLQYAEIINAIITNKYRIDEEIALNNNYHAEGMSGKWEAYQDYRNLAKQTAKSILGE